MSLREQAEFNRIWPGILRDWYTRMNNMYMGLKMQNEKRLVNSTDSMYCIHGTSLENFCHSCKELLAGVGELKQEEHKEKQTIFDKAKAIIYGDREKTHGKPDKNLQVIAALWTTYVSGQCWNDGKAGYKFSVEDVCMMMVLLKVARNMNNSETSEHREDIIGYAGLAERVREEKK